MNYVFFPLETLIRQIKLHPEYLPYVLGSCCAAALLAGLGIFYFRKFFTFVSKSLLRNLLRTILSSLAVMVLAFVVTLILSSVTRSPARCRSLTRRPWQTARPGPTGQTTLSPKIQ
jgi:hypothetical protein